MRPKHEGITGGRVFYCFVDFGSTPNAVPQIFVLPSDVVAEAIRSSHQAWLSNPGKNGRKRKDSSVRRLLPDYTYAYSPKPNPYPRGWLDKYKDAWHLLELDESDPTVVEFQ
jgi:hypothetical protein